MKSIYIFVIQILLLNDGAKSSAQANSEILSCEVHPRTLRRNEYEKIKFSDLPEDVFYVIFEQMDIDGLLTVFKANLTNTLSFVAIKTFQRIYRDYSVDLMRAYPDNDIYHDCEAFHVDSSSKRIEVYKFEAGSDLLQHFGCAMHKIEIQNQFFEVNESAVVSRFINEFARDSLTHLNLGYIKVDTFEHFRFAFDGVEDLTLVIETEQIQNIKKFLNESFPNVQRLELSLNADIDYSFIECRFNQLKHLTLNVLPFAWNRAHQFTAFMKLNPHIKTAEIERFPPDLVKQLDELLPNVETLTLEIYDDNNEPVHFSNVRDFTLYTNNGRFIENLSFERLESLQIQYIPELFDAWIRFFLRHNDLQRLHLNERFQRPNIDLLEFTAALPNIVEMKMEYTTHDRVKDIIKFIKSHDKLMRFCCSDSRFTQDELDTLRNSFDNDWTIEDIDDGVGLSFERKN